MEFWKTSKPTIQNHIKAKDIVQPITDNSYNGALYGEWWPIVNRRWDGEKTTGELGAVVKNIVDHRRLRYRAYDANDKIDIIKTLTSRFFQYIVGSGLKLQAQPNAFVLNMEAVVTEPELKSFIVSAEARFSVYANSKMSSYNGMQTLHGLAWDGNKSAFLGGDCLVITRFESTGPTVQIIDGEHIETPFFEDKLLKQVKGRGNFVKHGIEYNKKGEHIGFFVKIEDVDNPISGKFTYIRAKGVKSKRTMAWMIYGDKQRIDHKRGIPAISAILEKVNKLDRYTEAAVGKAEEAANLMMAIEHTIDSTGENPFIKAQQKKLQVEGEETSSYELADTLANRINRTTSKTAVNLPVGSKLVDFDTSIESNFGEFYMSIFNSIAASVNVPPEVALQMYNSNYSASRAAIGAWQFTIDNARKKFAEDFYIPFYKLWLEWEVLSNKIEAPGLIPALSSNDFMVIESYSSARFIGKKMPHIDPLKEVKAAREILGDDRTPLASREQVTEELNLGDWNNNYLKNLEETAIIETPEPETPANTQ